MLLLENGKLDFSKAATVAILVADQPTITGRIYPSDTVRKLVETFKPGMGQLSDVGIRSDGFVNLERVSHLITEMWFDESDKTLYAKIKILDTKNGDVVKHVLTENATGKSDTNIGFHLACYASLDGDVVKDDITYTQIFAHIPMSQFE